MVKYNKQKGFTLVEILVATAISAVFMAAAFGLYSSGSKMFSNGTWRQTTQKQAEKLIYSLVDNLQRASRPYVMSYVNNKVVKYTPVTANLYMKKNYSVAPDTTVSENTELLSFPVCKSNISNINSGIVKFVALYASKGSEPGVCRLKMQTVDYQHKNMLNPCIKNGFIGALGNENNFSGNSVDYGLGANVSSLELDYVYEVSISTYTTSILEKDKDRNGISLVIRCKYPKNTNATLKFDASASLDKEITIQND